MEASGWSGMGEFSVVVGSIRKLFVEVGVDLEDAAELLFAGYFVAFCVVVVVGLWTEGWFWVPLWVALNLDLMDYRILGRAVQKLWRSVRRHCNE
ncbi:hypothetical protein N431DRAFT_436728 [Stipitochalara longipes BDJ]|nr:hypothetical protein N431DRAFT_436728 [Stipitochalara longipes BDJ]